jgi:glutathione synthase/RimK-type ligase-like ATP-grasp enzyme
MTDDSIETQFERACRLNELGRIAEARDAYLEVLAREPSHRLALNNLGTLLYETGYRTAARTAYTEAVGRHPGDAMSRVNLGNALREIGEIEPARAHYEEALRVEPEHPEAHQGMAYVLAELGDAEGARRHRELGFRSRAVVALPYRGEGQPVSVLILAAAEGGNIPSRHLFDDRVFQTFLVFVEFFDRSRALPPHQIIFNAIGDADLASPALEAARRLLELTGAPVINPPEAIVGTGRTDIARRLKGIDGVVTARAVTLARGEIGADALDRNGFEFPVLIRTPGFHTGRHFVKVDAIEDLGGALAELPGEELTVLSYLDARGADGKVRKYRVMMIGGALYPLHVAISSAWKVHYFTAEMAESAEHRAEDGRFLEDMAGVLGARATAALGEIQSRLGLDYAGIDFGLNAAGEILLFEANATMVVNPPEREEKWAYRQGAVDRIYAAVRRMVMGRAKA